MDNLLTVPQAAALANVAKSTIYYHIHKSHKLQFIYGHSYYINPEQLEKLYPATTAGSKQAISNERYKSEINVSAETKQQARELIAQAQEVINRLQSVVIA